MKAPNAKFVQNPMDRTKLDDEQLRARFDSVLVAVSGGRDSTALALALAESKQRPETLELGWIRHGFRTDQVASERAQLQQLAERCRAPLHVVDVPPPPQWQPGQPIPETAARDARYRSLLAIARTRGLRVIATGHHRADCRETQVMMMLQRGGGFRALRGIPQQRQWKSLTLWRPLLRCEPEELERYLVQRGQRWCDDPSNLDQRMTRNRLRHRWLPQLRAQHDPLLASLDRLAASAGRALGTLSRQLSSWNRHHCVDSAAVSVIVLPRELLRPWSNALVHHWIEVVGAQLDATTPLRAGTASRLAAWWSSPSARGTQHVGALRLECSGGWLTVCRDADRPQPFSEFDVGPRWRGPDSASWTVRQTANCPSAWRARPRRKADRVRTRAGHRSLKQAMIDARIPAVERPLWPVFETPGHELWVPGLSASLEPHAEPCRPERETGRPAPLELTGLPDLKLRNQALSGRPVSEARRSSRSPR